MKSLKEAIKRSGWTIQPTPRTAKSGMINVKTHPSEGLMIDTVPLPEKPAKADTAMIGTWPTPEKPAKADTLKIDTVPLPEKPAKADTAMIGTWPTPERGLMIGTWPTPEGGLMIGTWPTPELPEAPQGSFPMPVTALSKKQLDKVTEGMPRAVADIEGGIKNAHIHVENEIVFLDKQAFKKLVGRIARKVAEDFAEETF